MSPIEKEARKYYKDREMTDNERKVAEKHFIEGYNYACRVLLEAYQKNGK